MAEEKQFTRLFDNMLFIQIFKTFRMAIQPGKLIIAFLAIAAVCIVGLLMDLNKTVVTAPGVTAAEISTTPMANRIISGFPTEMHCFVAAPEEVKAFKDRYDSKENRIGVFDALSRFCTARFNDAVTEMLNLNFTGVLVHLLMYAQAVVWALLYHPIYSLAFFAAAIVAIAIAGGAICRMAALQLASDERPGVVQGLQFGRQKLVHLICAPLTPLAIILVLGFFITLLGAIGNIPYAGELLVAVFLIFALLIGFFITLLVVGAIGGLNLMFPVIAYEGSGSFEAINRSFSLVFARPWRMAFYTFVAAVYGAACYIFVRLFMFILLSVTHGFLRLGLWVSSSQVSSVNKLEAIWPTPNFVNLFGVTSIQLNWSEGAAAFVISLAILVVFCCAAAFVISFFFSANTIIYALMRNRVDTTPIEEIYIESDGNPKDNAPAADLPTDI
ncbi:MAG: hypothetical protein Q7T18_11630 [Sedimentisphaerales bacterium]|nr:hypothetical protein [Sedimentisphaerales bacterium]